MKRSTGILLCLAFLAILVFPVQAQIQLGRSVFGNGGSPAFGANIGMNGTLGQSVIGLTQGDSYQHHIGFWFKESIPTSLDDLPGLPTIHQLGQNQPNPFNPKTSISYAIPTAELVNLRLYDINGRLVRTLLSDVQNPGFYEYVLDGRGMSSGVYFYRLEAGSFTETKKMVLLK